MSAFRAPTGTHDVLPPESATFADVIVAFATVVCRAGYGLVVSPMFEDAQVFRRSAGEETDVVRKEMYEFEDKGGRLLALRPEGTASVVRAYVQHRPPTPWKVWYATPAFRYERPQAGRYRQHHQLGIEAIGSEDPDLDVEVICLADEFLSSIGLDGLDLAVNSMGDDACLPAYGEALSSYLGARAGELCDEHRRRYTESPLRVLDCRQPECVAVRDGAPRLAEALCKPCRAHLERVTEGLDAAGVAWRRDDFLVRGFDYYTRTTFEFHASALDAAQDVVLGGGRYNKLVSALGGPEAPGIGFGSGIERLLLARKATAETAGGAGAVEVFVVDLVGGAAARDLTRALRLGGVCTERAFDDRSLKAQLRQADRSGARFAFIVGPDEQADGTVTVRTLRGEGGGGQETLATAVALERVRTAGR